MKRAKMRALRAKKTVETLEVRRGDGGKLGDYWAGDGGRAGGGTGKELERNWGELLGGGRSYGGFAGEYWDLLGKLAEGNGVGIFWPNVNPPVVIRGGLW